MRIILCGYNWAGCKALELLLAANHEVYVFTHASPYYVNDLQAFCEKKKLPYSLERIRENNLPFVPDMIVSIYYRYIIPPAVIHACKYKIFNLHPSMLPKYRGCSSLTWAMINGESVTGFTYHYINEGIDIGHIILQKEIAIEEFDTQLSLYYRVMFEALTHFNDVFSQVWNGVPGRPQAGIRDEDYYKRGCPHDGAIDESWDDAAKERFIRAMIYPPLPPATTGGQQVFSFQHYKTLVKP